MTIPEAQRAWRASYWTIAKWMAACGITRDRSTFLRGKTPANKRPLPEGFAEYFREHGHVKTCQHFACGGETMRRFMVEAGIPIKTRTRRKAATAPTVAPANDVMAPPPGYEQFKHKLGHVRTLYGEAA